MSRPPQGPKGLHEKENMDENDFALFSPGRGGGAKGGAGGGGAKGGAKGGAGGGAAATVYKSARRVLGPSPTTFKTVAMSQAQREFERNHEKLAASTGGAFANTPAGRANAAAREHAAAAFRAGTAARAAAAATKARLVAAEAAAVHAATLAKRAVEEAKRAAEEVAKAAAASATFRAQFGHGMSKKNATKAGKTVYNRVLRQTLKAKGLNRRGTRKNNRR